MEPANPRRKRSPSKAGGPAAKPELVPVEVKGQSHQLYVLQKLLTTKRGQARPAKLSGLGDILVPWYQKTIAKPGAKLGGITEIWEQMVPKHIADHARLIAFQRGTLSVALENATVRNELEYILRQGLLRQMQTLTKGAVFRIKTSIDGSALKDAN